MKMAIGYYTYIYIHTQEEWNSGYKLYDALGFWASVRGVGCRALGYKRNPRSCLKGISCSSRKETPSNSWRLSEN